MRNFQGDIGGTLGLFLGASMLTVVELIDWIVLTPTFWARKRGIHKDVVRPAELYDQKDTVNYNIEKEVDFDMPKIS